MGVPEDNDQDRNYEAFVRTFTHHEPRLRAFVRSLLPAWHDVDEVMQETSLVLWRKWNDFDPSTDFIKWGCVVARFEVLKHRRRKARDRHVFDADLIELLAEEGPEEVDSLEAQRRALEHCLKELPDNQRRLVMASYAPGRTLKETAAEIGKSATAFYKTLNRIRTALLECIQSTVRKEGTRAMTEENLKALVAEYCNGTLSDAEFAALQDALRADPEGRAYFRRYLNLDAALSEAAEVADADPAGWTAPAKARALTSRTSPLVWAPAAAAAVFVLIGLFLWKNVKPASDAPAVVEEPKAAGFAVLSRLVDANFEERDTQFETGDSLSADHIRLAGGAAQIEFFSGATVLLEGPCDFEVISANRARCHRGRLRAEVPPAARGFTILTPDSKVVDLGTEIGIAVAADGSSEVHVFDGEVEFHRGADGPVNSLRTGKAIAFQKGRSQELMAADGAAFARFDSFEPRSERAQRARFERWKTHSQQLRKDPRLIVYYPFEKTESGPRRVVNKAGTGDAERRGAMVGVKRAPGRWPWKGAAEFRGPGDRIRVYIPGEYSSLTLACWVRLDSVERMWNSLYLTDGYEQGEVHWQITEGGSLAYSMRIRETGKQRHQYLYLSPPFWTPELSGQWIHLATVFDADKAEVVHYLNGRELSRESSPPDAIVKTTRFGAGEIGNWGRSLKRKDPEYVVRSLNGLVDEFSMFSGVLTASEIATMYAAGNPGGP